MGAGVRPAGRGAGAVGDRSWTPPSGFGRRHSLTPRRSSRSSAAASAIRGASPASARRSGSEWTFGLVAETSRGLAGYMIGREAAGQRGGAEPRGGAGVQAARGRRRAAGGGTGGVPAPAGHRGLSRGAGIEPLGPGALSRAGVPAGRASARRTTAIPRRTPWCCGFRCASMRDAGTGGVTLVGKTWPDLHLIRVRTKGPSSASWRCM